MCGIAGILALDGAPPRAAELAAMAAALRHRGPDSDGYAIRGPLGLAMRRLSIIDVDGGTQPIANEDGTVWTVFNGEIYNHRELRAGLERRGHRFRTATDTEVIVHLYEEHGTGCVERMRGMFTFAVWDDRARRLVVARDRLGIKPLYFAVTHGRLLFASELKAILELADVPHEVDADALNHLLTALSTPADRSIVRDVRKLEPGHMIVASPSTGLLVRRYWELRFAPDRSRSEADFADELAARLDESVRLHLVSDVPVGAFLSGGVDSSAVVATMARLGASPIKTFSIGFEEATHDESRYARLVAESLGTEHHELVVRPDVASVLDELTWSLDEPFGDFSAIPTYMVARLAAQHVKVVLSGDGGDELFAGYDRYRVERRERRLHRRIPRGVRRLAGQLGRLLPDGMRGRNWLRHLALEAPARYLDSTTLFRAEERRRLLRREVWARVGERDPRAAELEREPGLDWLSTLQELDIRRYLPLDILTKVDRMTMACSLEARVPLLDHELVEFAATIPPEYQMRGDTTKHLFKRAIRDRVPAPVLTRPKQGFAPPLGSWFRGALRPFVRELLLSERALGRGFFERGAVERIIARQAAGRDLDFHVWTLISFEMWCRRFLDRVAQPAPAVCSGLE
jgi:asparagine synthase (glutamine-hydrolysing)